MLLYRPRFGTSICALGGNRDALTLAGVKWKRLLIAVYMLTIEAAEIGDLPHYNDDVLLVGYPPEVERFRAQLRQMLVFLNAFPLNKPEVMIGAAQTKFDADGRLTDEATADFIRQFLVALATWTERLR